MTKLLIQLETMGNICSTAAAVALANDGIKENGCIMTEFTAFQDAYCELGEDNFMPFNELCAAFWSYTSLLRNIPITNINSMIKKLVNLYPTLKHSGFTVGLHDMTYAYVVGIRLKRFPEHTLPIAESKTDAV